MKDQLSCETCKHFTQHYMCVDDYYYKIPCGHCDNGNVPRDHARRCITLQLACTLYERADDEKTDTDNMFKR